MRSFHLFLRVLLFCIKIHFLICLLSSRTLSLVHAFLETTMISLFAVSLHLAFHFLSPCAILISSWHGKIVSFHFSLLQCPLCVPYFLALRCFACCSREERIFHSANSLLLQDLLSYLQTTGFHLFVVFWFCPRSFIGRCPLHLNVQHFASSKDYLPIRCYFLSRTAILVIFLAPPLILMTQFFTSFMLSSLNCVRVLIREHQRKNMLEAIPVNQ